MSEYHKEEHAREGAHDADFRRGQVLMPFGYWWTVAVISWGVACALTRWRRLGPFSKIPALLASELPFIGGYLLIASTVLALVDGDLDSPGGAAGAAVALLALGGLAVVVCRALRAHAALHNAGRPERPWSRILRAPFFPGRRDVVRVRGLAYGDGPRRMLDVYHRRDRPASAPILLHFHGGGFYSGNKAREARPLIRHLASRRGFVCVSANYRQPHATLADQVADVRIRRVRVHPVRRGQPGSGTVHREGQHCPDVNPQRWQPAVSRREPVSTVGSRCRRTGPGRRRGWADSWRSARRSRRASLTMR
jgi:hypothetical protein